jgi:hypothetical protein
LTAKEIRLPELKVGYCTTGPARGCFIAAAALGPELLTLHPRLEEEVPPWDVYLSAPVELEEGLADDPFVVSDAQLSSLALEWGIRWSPSEQHTMAVVLALFPQLDQTWPIQEMPPARPSVGRKTRGWRGFEWAARDIVASVPVLKSFVELERPPDMEKVLSNPETGRTISELSFALEAYGYCLATVPLRETENEALDPWRWFGD